MSQRQQLLLQQLGIQQWIANEQYVERKTFDLLWRDQHDDAEATFYVPSALSQHQATSSSVLSAHEILKPEAVQMQPNLAVSLQNAVATKQLHDAEPISLDQFRSDPFQSDQLRSDLSIAEQLKSEHSLVQETALTVQTAAVVESKVVSQEITFDYQVILHDKFLIFAEVTDSAQRKLLHHIQKACYAEQSQLKWPLNIQSWDSDDQLVHSYLHGFFAIHRSKLLIMLGDVASLSQLIAGQFQQFDAPSLQQMIETPTQKRVLWQKIYPYIYEIEQSDEKESRNL